MPKYIFRMMVAITEGADVDGLIVIEADTREQAARAASAHTLEWWGVPTGYSVESMGWEYEHQEQPGTWIDAKPTCKGEFSDAEIAIIRRATHVTTCEVLSDEEVIALIVDRQDSGMPRPPTEMLSALFGPEFAARCAVQLED